MDENLPLFTDAVVQVQDATVWMNELETAGADDLTKELFQREPFLTAYIRHRTYHMYKRLLKTMSEEAAMAAARLSFRLSVRSALMLRLGYLKLLDETDSDVGEVCDGQ